MTKVKHFNIKLNVFILGGKVHGMGEYRLTSNVALFARDFEHKFSTSIRNGNMEPGHDFLGLHI